MALQCGSWRLLLAVGLCRMLAVQAFLIQLNVPSKDGSYSAGNVWMLSRLSPVMRREGSGVLYGGRQDISAKSQRRIRRRPRTVISAAPKSETARKSVDRTMSELEDLLRVVTALVQMPIDGGCPWTAEQRALDILKYVRDEVDEIDEELTLGPASPHYALLSELGDLLFCAFLLVKVCERDKLGDISLAGAAAFAAAKVRRRAPFVFEPKDARPFPNTLLTGDEASAIWKRIKRMEKEGLIPICPDGYDFVNGTCRLSDSFYDTVDNPAENAPATAIEVASQQDIMHAAALPLPYRDAAPLEPVAATQSAGEDRLLPLLVTFAAGIAVGVCCCNLPHPAV